MTTPFHSTRGLILVDVMIAGPSGFATATLALDTGAIMTTIASTPMAMAGYSAIGSTTAMRMTTASGVLSVPTVVVRQLSALGHDRRDFPVVIHTLPPSAGVDGVLGLDFFRQQILTIDFRAGQLSLA